jgi:hypothetical protein
VLSIPPVTTKFPDEVKVWYLYPPDVTSVPPEATNFPELISFHSVPLYIFEFSVVVSKYISPVEGELGADADEGRVNLSDLMPVEELISSERIVVLVISQP